MDQAGPILLERTNRIEKFGSCKFCDQPAVACCEWPVEHFVLTSYELLKVGDRVRRAFGGKGQQPPATVIFVGPGLRKRAIRFPARLQIFLAIRGKQKEFLVFPYSPVQVAKECPCLMPVCENHLRCVEPGVEYCADHWQAWSAVA